MYLQAGFGPDEHHGTLVYADVHQSAPRMYRALRPVRGPGALAWQPCTIGVQDDGSLRVTLGEEEGEGPEPSAEGRFLRLLPVALADETWFAAQQATWHLVSAREAHKPPAPAPVVGTPAVVPSLPPARAPAERALAVPAAVQRFGRYHALVVGSAEYIYLPAVATAEGDASAVSQLLASRYGFEVSLLMNPHLEELTGALARYERELSPDDNLLIYYAGHGFVSDELGRCYWFPVEALGNDPRQGLASDDVATALSRMKAKHVMVVADSCFTGAQRREVGLQNGQGDSYDKLARTRARVVLSSGGLEPIQNGQASGHSVFTGAFLEALSTNDEVIDGTRVFQAIQRIVPAGASQTPEYANILGAGDGGSDFVFVPGR